MLICKSCSSIVQDIDYHALKHFNPLMKDYKAYILDNFFSSPRIKMILNALNIEESVLRESYASTIYDFFQSFTTDKPSFSFCPTVSEFFKEIIEYEDSAQVILLMYTQFKNSLLSILLDEKICIDIDSNLRIEIFNQMVILLDFNLSIVIQEYNNLLFQKEKDMQEHSRLIEEQTIASKTDANGIITFVSDSFSELCGYSKEELIGKKHSMLKHKDYNPITYEKMWQRITMGMIWKGKIKNVRKDGKEIVFQTTIIPEYNNKNHIIGYIALRNDITDKIKRQKDSLTGIMNRDGFNDMLINSIDDFRLSNKSFSLVFIDIDKFKNVNDTYGHIVGDYVLQSFSKIIQDNIRDIDVFARWGGEEFILILKGLDFDTSLNATERIRLAIEKSNFDTVGKVTASFGIIEYDDKYTDIDTFLADVDRCLYYSKENGRNLISYKEDNEIKIYKKQRKDFYLTSEEVSILLEADERSDF